MRLLIAHQDANAREALARVAAAVPGVDLELVESSEGGEAMELLLAVDSPRVAVVDWDLPGCDGLELCRLTRAYYEAGRPYVILLAGKCHSVADALEAGADDCVRVPVPADEMRARIGVGCRFAALPVGRDVPEALGSSESDLVPTLRARRYEIDLLDADDLGGGRLDLESMLALQ